MEAPHPEHAIVVGLARTARSENEHLRLIALDIAEGCEGEHASRRILQALSPTMRDDEVADRDGTLFIPRVEADDDLNSKLRNGARRKPRREPFHQSRALSLKIAEVGLLETLGFGDDEELLDSTLADDELEVEVKASGLNFRDVATAIGIIEGFKLGRTCSSGSEQHMMANYIQATNVLVSWLPRARMLATSSTLVTASSFGGRATAAIGGSYATRHPCASSFTRFHSPWRHRCLSSCLLHTTLSRMLLVCRQERQSSSIRPPVESVRWLSNTPRYV